jgi:hypothetical protein
VRAIEIRDLEELGPQRFQELVAAVLLAEHPEAEQLGGADGGADILLQRGDGKAKAWQVKLFTKEIRWAHCRDSLDAVVESYDVDEVVFVFHRDLGFKAKENFDSKLRSRHPGVAVSYISGSQIISRLRTVNDGRLVEEFFGPDPQDQATAIAAHLGSLGLAVTPRPEADEMAADLTLAAEAGGRDRYYRTAVSLTTGDAPPSSWEEQPSMVLTREERDRTLRVEAWPQSPEDSRRRLSISFPDDDAREEATERIRREFATRGEARVSGEATVRILDIPEAMRALGGSDELHNTRLIAEEAHPAELAGEFDGEPVSRSLVVYTVPPLAWPEVDKVYEFGRIDKGLRLFVAFQEIGDEMKLSFALNPEVRAGVELEDALDAARLLVAVDEGTASISIPSLDVPGWTALPAIDDEPRRNEHRGLVWLFEKLILLRDALGVTFDLGQKVTAADADALDTAIEVLESGTGQFTVTDVSGHFDEEHLAKLPTPKGGPLLARFPATADVFGQSLTLGSGEAELPPPDSVQISDTPDPSIKRVEFRWDEKQVAPFKLIRGPDDEPAAPGVWPVGEAPPLDP